MADEILMGSAAAHQIHEAAMQTGG